MLDWQSKYNRGNEKSILHRYATLSFLPLHSSGILSIYFVYLNKNRNTKVCSIIPLSKKPLHIENSLSICSANQSTGSCKAKTPGKKKFLDKFQYIHKI